MALIRINNEEENLLGAVSFDREAVYGDDGRVKGMAISGILAIHEYVDEINAIESERYKLDDV